MTEPLRLEWLDPRTLKPNPKNFRRHPEAQKKVLAAMLTEVGWAGALLVNETTGNLIDGHARRQEAIERNEAEVPTLIGSWSEADEKKILATLDPIAAMAEQADDIYRDLMAGIETESEDLRAWCDRTIEAITSLGECPFGDEMKPETLPPPEIEGDDSRTGRFILVYQNDSEKELLMRRLGIDGKKVIYQTGDLSG